MKDYIVCEYNFQTHLDNIDSALEELCKSQSTSSADWGEVGRVENETKEIVDRFGANPISCELIDESDKPDLPLVSNHQKSDIYKRVNAKIAIPIRNFGGSIPALLTAAAGEIHYLDQFTSIKLMDIDFPPEYLATYKGCKFGEEGLKSLLHIEEDRPVMIGVIKPSLCPADMFAKLAYESALGGIDMVKDDELLSNIPDSPLVYRVRKVTEALDKASQKTGKKTAYQVNITDDVANLHRNYDMAIAAGAETIMINAMAVGLSATRMITDYANVPVASHFDLTGCNAKVPYHGISHKLLAKLHRMVGVDNLVIPSPESVLMEYNQDIMDELNSCREELGYLKPCFPFIGGGNRADNMEKMIKLTGSNVGYIVGHGIYAHPDGAEAGVKSLYQAWDRIKGDNIKPTPELNKAKEFFGGHFL